MRFEERSAVERAGFTGRDLLDPHGEARFQHEVAVRRREPLQEASRAGRPPNRERASPPPLESMPEGEEESGEGTDMVRVEVGEDEVRDSAPRQPQPRQRLYGPRSAVEEDARTRHGHPIRRRGPVSLGNHGAAPDDDEFAARGLGRGHATCGPGSNSTPTTDETPASSIVTP